jgi:tetratricopeptide (TPR) repeat protein
MRKSKNSPRRPLSWILLLCLLIAGAPAAFAQSGDRAARAALWDGYQLPAGKFARFVDRRNGFSFRYPADWKQGPGPNGGTVFKPASETVNLIVIIEEIPDGSGLANYVSGVMQSFRSELIKPESVTVRRVMSGGLEWREIAHEIETPGGVAVRQTMWFTAVGPRAYGLALSAQDGEMEAYEPLFKRMISSVHVGAAGHWNEEYETLRDAFTAGSDSTPESEIEAGRVAEALRTGRESFASSAGRMAGLFAASKDAAIDLITDADPQVRAAAISALGKSGPSQSVDLLIWALSDKDVFTSSAAAHALVARGALNEVKSKLATLAENPAAVVHVGVALGESASRELIEELLRSDGAKQHLAALRLALVTEKFDSRLPYSKLLASTDLGALHSLVAVLRRHAGPDAVNELVKFLRTENELWAARALGEIAGVEIAQELNKRVVEIDAQLSKLGKAAVNRSAPKRAQKRPDDEKGHAPETFALVTAAELKNKPEDVRLALLRGELETAARKIKFRDRWDQAKAEVERQRIKTEIYKEHADLIGWSEIALVAAPADVADGAARQGAGSVSDRLLATMKEAPTTGETLFPKETFSYVMAPNLAATMERIDSALSGVQMATVRDQMTFTLILKAMKASLASRLGADVTGDASKATGVDLKSPIAMASWQAPEGGGGSAATRSALTVRVTDRARFERLLATYQESFGDFDQFFTVAAALSRFAGIIPAVVPVIFASMASNEARGKAPARSSSESRIPSLKSFSHLLQENVGGLPVTTLIRPVISERVGAKWEAIRIAYLGETAIVSSSREAIADLLSSGASGGASGRTIAQSEAFTKARAEKGEVIFFSRLSAALKPLLDLAESKEDNDQIAAFIKAFGVESGALQLTPNSWETVFKIGLSDNEFIKSFKPFKVDALAAPRELIPRSAILYAGAVVDPAKLYGALKSLETDKYREKATQREKEIDAEFEKLIVPNMQGEAAAALLSLKPVFDGAEWPAVALALKLKNGDLAGLLRAGKFFANFPRATNATALGNPVVPLGEGGGAPFVTVTDDYFLLADSVETLRLFESKEKFSSSRDFARSTKDTPGGLAMFATYDLESAFDEASKALADDSSQRALPFISAVIHAFHSQRAYLAVEKDGLVGRLAVAFDREGRYSVGDLANAIGDFDLANAMITPKGLTVIGSPRVESMTVRVSARTPGIAPRVRDDLAKFDFQRVESSDPSTVVVTTSARRIPEKLTTKLPVAGAEFAPFLNPTARINSKDPRIFALAKQIAGDDADGRSVARKIGEWTYRNLKWKKVESDTVETLASREADCLEHSELYVALARSLGLPARVVTGAALGGGAFGSHAWVEIYLGKWVEVDPTWGLMDRVDATHMRFDGEAFTSYAMLNQLDIEITSARRTTADFQRDPISLVKEFSLDPASRDLAFDLSLTAEQAFTPTGWANLDEKQRAAVISAFEKTVKGMWETWDAENPMPARVLLSDVKADRASVTLLRGETLLRLTLASRDGAWFITEHEVVDDALPEFADALQGALRPDGRRGLVFGTSIDGAAKHIEKLIAREGEKPELLLLKSRVLSAQELEGTVKAQVQTGTDKTDSSASVEVLKKAAERWPDFAPVRLALARALLYSGGGEDAIKLPSKDAERAIAELNAYARLAPYDPRPWRDLGGAYERFDKLEDAESALEKAVELDREYLDHYSALVNFHLLNDHPDKAKSAFARMLKASSDVDEIFGQFSDDEGYDADYAKALERLLLAFPKELEGSVTGLVMLAGVQEAQNKIGDAIKSMQRAIAIEPYASSYEYLSSLYRSQRRFTEALAAANQAVKLDEDSADSQFERACSLAQLGRKREAMAALKRMLEIDPETVFDPDEPDLQPLAAMLEFKAMKEKMKEASAPADEAKPAETKQEKTDKTKP